MRGGLRIYMTPFLIAALISHQMHLFLVVSVSLNDADLYCINHIASPVDLCAGWSFSGHRKLTTITRPRNYGLLTVYERIRIFMSRSLF